MIILSIDTSCPTLKIGIFRERLLASSVLEPPVTHAETIIPAIEKALQSAKIKNTEIELIAVAGGPGSFTGLRIGIATSKGLSLGLGVPMALVPTLDVYGVAWRELGGIVVPLLDARKHRVYCARYHHGERIGEWMDIELATLVSKLQVEEEVHFVGPDADLAETICLERSGWTTHSPEPERDIEALAMLGARRYNEKGPAEDSAGPMYLREPEIGEPLAR
jgi:tRNA threonylcarbamoyladenosine biosynthesis protein TsaB